MVVVGLNFDPGYEGTLFLRNKQSSKPVSTIRVTAAGILHPTQRREIYVIHNIALPQKIPVSPVLHFSTCYSFLLPRFYTVTALRSGFNYGYFKGDCANVWLECTFKLSAESVRETLLYEWSIVCMCFMS